MLRQLSPILIQLDSKSPLDSLRGCKRVQITVRSDKAPTEAQGPEARKEPTPRRNHTLQKAGTLHPKPYNLNPKPNIRLAGRPSLQTQEFKALVPEDGTSDEALNPP